MYLVIENGWVAENLLPLFVKLGTWARLRVRSDDLVADLAHRHLVQGSVIIVREVLLSQGLIAWLLQEIYIRSCFWVILLNLLEEDGIVEEHHRFVLCPHIESVGVNNSIEAH